MKIEKIIVHHSGTDSKTTTHESIERAHKAKNKIAIGYHGTINHEGLFKKGREEHIQGAHCRHGGWNRKSLGYCIIGNFENEQPTQAALHTAIHYFARKCMQYNLRAKDVISHSETGAATLCAGKNLDMNLLRKKIAELLNFTI